MNRSIIIWAVAVIVVAAAFGTVYLSSKPVASADHSNYPNLWLDGPATPKAAGSAAGLEHELAGLKAQLQKNPNHTPVLLRMAEVARSLGKAPESIDYLTQAVAGDPKNVEARLELGRELFEAGQVEKAIQVTKEILDQKPENVDALYNLGAIYGNLGQDDLARQFFQKAVASDPNSTSGKKAQQGLATLSGTR